MTVHIVELCVLRHVSARSDLAGSWWNFLPSGGLPKKENRIIASIRLGSAPLVEVEIPVCSHRNIVAGCWIIVRRGEHHFLLTAARMPLNLDRLVKSVAFHPSLPVGSLLLADATPEIAEELGAV